MDIVKNILGKQDDGDCYECKHFDENNPRFNDACRRSPRPCKFKKR